MEALQTRRFRGAALSALLAAACAVLAAGAPAPARGEASAPCQGIEAYSGIGTWVDLFDGGLWANPERAVAGMDRHGVTTLYLQTSSNEYTTPPVFRPDRTARFIAAAHARGMCVVAWYLAPLVNPARELGRVRSALRFTTAQGERFDAFGLDIEPSAETPREPRRTRNLMTLSRAIRRSVGATYALGAITPSPFGIRLRPTFWPRFPYRSLAAIYDVFVPMGYYTYHQKTAAGAYQETLDNLAIVREETGDLDVPIALAGGISNASSGAQTRAFRQAVDDDAGAIGVSLYDYATTGPEDWAALRGLTF
jgi:hypothetical protein